MEKGIKSRTNPYKANELRDHTKRYSPFVNAEDKKNPHKSVGDLIQPKLSEKFKEFMG